MLPALPLLPLLSLLACVQDLDWRDSADTGPAPEPPPTLADAARGRVADGTSLTLTGTVAGTAASTDGGTFFVQDAAGTAGLRVDLAWPGAADAVRPGDIWDLVGVLDTGAGSPRLLVWEPDWMHRTGGGDAPEPADLDLVGVPGDRDAGRLVRLEDRAATGCTDALGDTPLGSSLTLVDRLGPLPALGRGARIQALDGVLVRTPTRWELWAVAIAGVEGGAPCP